MNNNNNNDNNSNNNNNNSNNNNNNKNNNNDNNNISSLTDPIFERVIKVYYQIKSVYNSIYNSSRFMLPVQDSSLALGELVSSFLWCQGHPSGTVPVCLVLARWLGARSPHCGADPKPCVWRLSQIFVVPFQYSLVRCNSFLRDFWTSE